MKYLYTFLALILSISTFAQTWDEVIKTVASDAATDDRFGFSVCIEGDRAVVGALRDNNKTGAAYLFEFDGTTWVETLKLTASDGTANDFFGASVSISGDRIIVGAYGDGFGSAYIYEWDGTTWLETKLTASNGAYNDWFGRAVAISGDKAVVGANQSNSFDGSAYIFEWNGTNWVETIITPSNSGVVNQFGASVSILGDRAVIGCYDAFGGAVYVYEWNGTVWAETILSPSGTPSVDLFGYSVSISGDRVVVGASYDSDEGNQAGAVYVYEWDGTTWAETKLTASDGVSGDWFGWSVGISGDKIIAGAMADDDSGSSSGSAYILEWDGTNWIETKLIASDGAASDEFGYSVAISGNKTLIGAQRDDTYTGSAYLFALSSSSSYTVTGCFSYTVPSGDETYTITGQVMDTIPNACGADSIMTIDITINTVDVTTTLLDYTISANATGATYQWINCADSTEIVGATNADYTATENGNYAVIVTENGCTDTSACVAIVGLGMNSYNATNNYEIYPNPATDQVTISNFQTSITNITVVDIAGRVFKSYQPETAIIDISDLRSGIYFLQLQVGDHVISRKIIKS